MGYTEYNMSARSLRASTEGYHTKSVHDTFVQQKLGKIHADMDPKGLKNRECRDSATHPLSFPVLFALDVTGSMTHIPAELIKDGLPTLMSKLLQNGCNDASLLFSAIGDHEYDNSPLQVAQFESGDAELDMWLTRTWLEKGGGGNAGESYLLAWYLAAFHTATDHWDKRKAKGVLITTGDEPGLKALPMNALKSIMGDTANGQATYTDADLLKAAQEKYHVYHIDLHHGGRDSSAYWKQLLGDHSIVLTDYTEVPNTVADIVLKHYPAEAKQFTVEPVDKQTTEPTNNTSDGDDWLLK